MNSPDTTVSGLPEEELRRLALVVVDAQRGFREAQHWGPRNNPQCETNIVRLLSHWRKIHAPVVFVRHDSTEPGSPLRPDRPGNAFLEIVSGVPDLLVVKSVNSAFHGTPDLHIWLGEQSLDGLVICGITTNHCCETTARIGGNLGHRVVFVLDATHTFDRAGPGGQVFPAALLHDVTAANLSGEFADVVSTTDVVGRNETATGRR